MSANSNTTSTLVTIGNREDLDNIITRVVASQTPFLSSLKVEKATQPYHETQTETLAAASATTQALEGNQNNTSIGAPNLTTRIGCRVQINVKIGEVTGTQEATIAAGRTSELARQKMLKGMELKRDQELRFLGNYASNAESGATARKTAGALAWITTNTSFGSGGSAGGFSGGDVAAATPGTTRTFTEQQVKDVQATAFSNGATPDTMYLSGTLKQKFSSFTGIADIRADVKGESQATIFAGADVYVGDFGAIKVVPHPYGISSAALLVDVSKWARASLRPMMTQDLAKTGDATAFQIIAEEGLACKNQLGSAAIFAIS